jgi:hypothetical protein
VPISAMLDLFSCAQRIQSDNDRRLSHLMRHKRFHRAVSLLNRSPALPVIAVHSS